MVTSDQFKAHCEGVLARIQAACVRSGRDPASVRLLPVTKTHPVEAALLAYGFGLRAVGANRVQEAAQKRPLAPADLRWELIGHLQSNKAKHALQAFDVIQSVDSPELATRLGRLAGEMGLRREVLIQVNSGDDPAKFGCDLADAPRLLEAALAQPALSVKGLMAIAPLSDDPAVADRTFAELRLCRDALAALCDTPCWAAVLARAALWLLGADRYGERFWQRLREDIANAPVDVPQTETAASLPTPANLEPPPLMRRPGWLAPRGGWLR
jgi:pyridoxal phosphate enzyme (YggS family)